MGKAVFGMVADLGFHTMVNNEPHVGVSRKQRQEVRKMLGETQSVERQIALDDQFIGPLNVVP